MRVISKQAYNGILRFIDFAGFYDPGISKERLQKIFDAYQEYLVFKRSTDQKSDLVCWNEVATAMIGQGISVVTIKYIKEVILKENQF